MHDLQYNGGKQVHTATGLIACTHKSALSLTHLPVKVQCISVLLTNTGFWMRKKCYPISAVFPQWLFLVRVVQNRNYSEYERYNCKHISQVDFNSINSLKSGQVVEVLWKGRWPSHRVKKKLYCGKNFYGMTSTVPHHA